MEKNVRANSWWSLEPFTLIAEKEKKVVLWLENKVPKEGKNTKKRYY